MAITTADGWFGAARQNAVMIRKTATATTVAVQPFSLLDVAGNPGAGSLAVGNTTTGIVPDDTTAGFPALNSFGGGNTGYLAAARYTNSVASGLQLYDRLYHAGSVSMTALATTTFSSQPSYVGRLPGGSYLGLEIFLEINAAVSATATTISVAYTNEAGTTGRTTAATSSLSGFTTRRVIPMPLQAGDKGVQKIESVTVGGTVATTGSFNVIVGRRLAEFNVRIQNGADIQGWDVLGAPVVYESSALWPFVLADGTSSGIWSLDMTILNG